MGNILFFVQNTVSVDGQNSSSKFTVRVKVRADLQAAATEQTLSRSIPLAVRIAGLERISFQPQLCPLQCFKDHGTVYDQIFHQWEFAQRLQSNNASLTVPQKNGTGKTRQTIDPHKKRTIRLAVGAVVYAIGMALTVFAKLPTLAELAFLIVAYVILGWDVVWQAVKNITRGQVFDEHFLMSVSTIGAFAIGEYPEAVAVMLFYQVGEFFQSLAVKRSRKSISDLMDIRPDSATVKRNGVLQVVSPESVAVGEIIVVKPGEKIPLDGIVVDGESMLDTKALTGESVPRSIRKGDEALSGCINQSGLLTLKVTKSFGE